MPCDGESTLSLFDGANMLSTIFNFQIYFMKFHEIVLQAAIYAGTFFIFRAKPSSTEGKAPQTPTDTDRSEQRKYHIQHDQARETQAKLHKSTTEAK
jgi:hypothetical protein